MVAVGARQEQHLPLTHVTPSDTVPAVNRRVGERGQITGVSVVAQADVLVGMLVRARSMPGRPIPDAMIVAAAAASDTLPLATFDADQARHGVPTREP